MMGEPLTVFVLAVGLEFRDGPILRWVCGEFV